MHYLVNQAILTLSCFMHGAAPVWQQIDVYSIYLYFMCIYKLDFLSFSVNY